MPKLEKEGKSHLGEVFPIPNHALLVLVLDDDGGVSPVLGKGVGAVVHDGTWQIFEEKKNIS